MICIKVSREELRKISSGKEGKITKATIPDNATDTRGLTKILDGIIKSRYLGKRRNT